MAVNIASLCKKERPCPHGVVNIAISKMIYFPNAICMYINIAIKNIHQFPIASHVWVALLLANSERFIKNLGQTIYLSLGNYVITNLLYPFFIKISSLNSLLFKT